METTAQVFESIVGSAGVCSWETLSQGQQNQIRQAAPQATIRCLVSPATQAELADVIACADRDRQPLLICGSGSKLAWGSLVQVPSLVVVSTERLNRVIDHAVGDLTVTVESGVKFADLQAILAKSGQFLALDPSFSATATIGGITATADTGSLRQRYHSVRDMLLGISFVRADGQAVKAGGRVVKNVAGYDLMKLMTGAYGSLGVLSQLTFRVYPLPETSQTVVLSGEPEAIAQAAQILLNSALTPTAIDLLSTQAVSALEVGQGMALVVRFQSILLSVKEQAVRLLEVGQALNLAGTLYCETDEADLWQRLQEQMGWQPRLGAITCKIGVRPSEAVAVLTQMEQWVPGCLGLVHAGSGLGRLTLPVELRSPVLSQLRSLCQQNQGFLSVLQAPVSLKQQVDVWGYAGNAPNLMQKIKHQFDPNALLNPQRFLGR